MPFLAQGECDTLRESSMPQNGKSRRIDIRCLMIHLLYSGEYPANPVRGEEFTSSRQFEPSNE